MKLIPLFISIFGLTAAIIGTFNISLLPLPTLAPAAVQEELINWRGIMCCGEICSWVLILVGSYQHLVYNKNRNEPKSSGLMNLAMGGVLSILFIIGFLIYLVLVLHGTK